MTFKQLIRFTSDGNAIERILRLFQALSQIIAASDFTNIDTELWWELRRNFALGRRYLRFFRFLECFAKAADILRGLDENGAGLREVLLVGRWTFMGAYLGLESVTILDAMRIWQTPWAATCLLEGNKFWFYALVCEIAWGGLLLFEKEPDVAVSQDSEQEKSKSKIAVGKDEMAKRKKKERASTKRRMFVNVFDLFIPGDVTGWIPTSLAVVGWASTVSTLLSMMDIWDKMGSSDPPSKQPSSSNFKENVKIATVVKIQKSRSKSRRKSPES